MTKPTKRTRKVKAWAVVVYDDFISALESSEGLRARAVFDDWREAKKFIAANPDLPNDTEPQTPTLTECTITYTLPATNKKKSV